METMQDVRTLDGTLDVLVAEDSIHIAHITSSSRAQFRGAFVTLRHAKSCSRLGLGLSILSIGLSVLFADNHLTEAEVTDLTNEVEDLIRGNEEKSDDIPF